MRRRILWLVEWKWFDRVIIVLISMSTFCLAATDYSNTYPEFNRTLEIVGNVISVIFAHECLLKIFAHGLISGERTYLRSYWNVLDFVIACSSIIGTKFKLFRMVSVIRPLRTI
jgi:voltage-dependent calcium channel L type alpha-1D